MVSIRHVDLISYLFIDQLPVFLKYSVPLKSRENFCLSCEPDTAAKSF